MDEGECIHGMTHAWCTICNGREKREKEARDKITSSFQALYPGKCAVCQSEFAVGDIISRTGDGRYICGEGQHW